MYEDNFFFFILQLRKEFKIKKALLKVYVELLRKSDYNNDKTVTIDEWMIWITQKKQEEDRKNWFLNPFKSFIFIVSIIQLVIGIGSRIEKNYYCNGTSAHHCHYVRPFHDAMIFKSCLRFEAWRYFTHAFVHHGLPHLTINLALQLFFGKFPHSKVFNQKVFFFNLTKWVLF